MEQEKMIAYGDTPAYPAKLGYGAGISKREYFAGLALQGILAYPGYTEYSKECLAQEAVLYADTLLNELAKSKH